MSVSQSVFLSATFVNTVLLCMLCYAMQHEEANHSSITHTTASPGCLGQHSTASIQPDSRDSMAYTGGRVVLPCTLTAVPLILMSCQAQPPQPVAVTQARQAQHYRISLEPDAS